jgi:outer membrane protein W
LALLPGASQATNNIIRFAGASIQPTGDLTETERETIPLGDGTTLIADERVDIEADDAFGFCLDYEHRFPGHFGLGLTVMRASHDVNATGTAAVRIVDDGTGEVILDATERIAVTADADMTPVLLGANYHFGSGKADFYAGPFLGWVMFDDIVFEGDRTSLKDEFAYGGTLGVDVPFGKGQAAFSAAVRYMVAAAEPNEPDSQALDIDPLVLMVGVGYQF